MAGDDADPRSDEAVVEGVSDLIGTPVGIAVEDRATSPLTRRVFFDRVVAQLRREVDPEIRDFHSRAYGHLLKIHYENDRIHYEVWPDSRTGQIEIGLHFEGGPVSTAAYLHFFDARIVELKHLLGTDVELERWTVSWGHLYYLIPFMPFDRGKATRAAELLVALVNTLEPLVRAAGVPRERVDQPVERRRFRRSSRA
jgi:hypothetical protein